MQGPRDGMLEDGEVLALLVTAGLGHVFGDFTEEHLSVFTGIFLKEHAADGGGVLDHGAERETERAIDPILARQGTASAQKGTREYQT